MFCQITYLICEIYRCLFLKLLKKSDARMWICSGGFSILQFSLVFRFRVGFVLLFLMFCDPHWFSETWLSLTPTIFQGEFVALLFSLNHLIGAFCRQGGPPCQHIHLLLATIWEYLTPPPNPMCRNLAFSHGRTSNGLKPIVVTWHYSHFPFSIVLYVEHIWF